MQEPQASKVPSVHTRMDRISSLCQELEQAVNGLETRLQDYRSESREGTAEKPVSMVPQCEFDDRLSGIEESVRGSIAVILRVLRELEI